MYAVSFIVSSSTAALSDITLVPAAICSYSWDSENTDKRNAVLRKD